MIFKMYSCDFGIKYNGVNYDFDHVDEVVIEDPQMTRLVRGANASNQVGLVYTEGTKEPKKISVTLIGVAMEMHGLLEEIFRTKSRCEVYAIDRDDGSSKIGKDCILSQKPMQLQIGEAPESMNVVLAFETFNLQEVHKS